MARAAAGRPHTRAVAYFGTFEPDYPRNAVLITGLREHGVEVHEFRAALPPLTAAEMAGARGAARLAAGVVEAHLRLLAQHRGRLDIDAVIVGYPGHFLVPFGRLLAAFRGAKLVFDPLVSLLDTFAGDRGLVQAGGAKAAAVRVVDEVAFRLPSLILADTWAHASYYQEAFRLARARIAVAPVGALPEPRADGAARSPSTDGPLTVLQYGKWSPLHGADVVLSAAELLRDEPFRFVLIGEGQLSGELRARIAAGPLTNVEWVGALPPPELRERTLAADVCLGVFGRSEKAGRVVPNKVFDALACGRPVITAASDGAREWLRDGEDALLTPAGDAAALAAALRRLADNAARARLGKAALALYRRAFTPAAVAGDLLTALEAA
ncbi:MAG TPA: glycosyltransferase [Thermoleophilia bacterium]|nr:glycosyltransferase [Thermoleophilia bacterium]